MKRIALLLFLAYCGPKHLDSRPSEDILSYGLMSVQHFNQCNALIQKEIVAYNKAIRRLNYLQTTLDVRKDSKAERLKLHKQALESLERLRELFEDSGEDLGRIEAALKAMG